MFLRLIHPVTSCFRSLWHSCRIPSRPGSAGRPRETPPLNSRAWDGATFLTRRLQCERGTAPSRPVPQDILSGPPKLSTWTGFWVTFVGRISNPSGRYRADGLEIRSTRNCHQSAAKCLVVAHFGTLAGTASVVLRGRNCPKRASWHLPLSCPGALCQAGANSLRWLRRSPGSD
jgi:hypothetical protein